MCFCEGAQRQVQMWLLPHVAVQVETPPLQTAIRKQLPPALSQPASAINPAPHLATRSADGRPEGPSRELTVLWYPQAIWGRSLSDRERPQIARGHHGRIKSRDRVTGRSTADRGVGWGVWEIAHADWGKGGGRC